MSTTSDQINRRQLLAETTHHPNTLELADLAYIDSDESTESDDHDVTRNRRSFLGATAGAVAALTLGMGAMTESAEAACNKSVVCHVSESGEKILLCVGQQAKAHHLKNHSEDMPSASRCR